VSVSGNGIHLVPFRLVTNWAESVKEHDIIQNELVLNVLDTIKSHHSLEPFLCNKRCLRYLFVHSLDNARIVVSGHLNESRLWIVLSQ